MTVRLKRVNDGKVEKIEVLERDFEFYLLKGWQKDDVVSVNEEKKEKKGKK